MLDSPYQVGGSLNHDDSNYVVRNADTQLYQALIEGKFCYIFNSRQMGKSSLLVQMKHKLEQEGYRCAAIDMTNVGGEHINLVQWYKGFVSNLWMSFKLLAKLNLKNWFRQEEEHSPIQILSRFLEELLWVQFPQNKIIIFIDEIDSILGLNFSINEFFALIRHCYEQREINPDYHRLTFALFGVATPSDLMTDLKRTPFNLGVAIELKEFKWEEALPLAKGLEGKVTAAPEIFKEILAWTGGQPFLTQKLCQLVWNWSEETVKGCLKILPSEEKIWLERFVRSHLIYNWEIQDEPEHLKTIRDRPIGNEQRAFGLLENYKKILQATPV